MPTVSNLPQLTAPLQEPILDPGQDRDDPLYWRMRRERDAALLRQHWWWRHYLAGNLVSQRQRRHLALAANVEAKVATFIRLLGYAAHQTTSRCPFDLWVANESGQAIRVEVKASLYNVCADAGKGGRYQANIRHHHQADLVIFVARNGRDWPFVIPMAQLGNRANIAIWSQCPADYTGRWAGYLNAWNYLDEAVARARPAVHQLALPEVAL